MNQTCKVCGEPAAGFHFGAFTCEGCKSFFGRSYNNVSSISECKNNGKCIIDKKNRTTCKACRLRKCYSVGMSKGGSRYGRRSNWFKIHCLLQEQQQQAIEAANKAAANGPSGSSPGSNGFVDMATAAAAAAAAQQQRNSHMAAAAAQHMGGLLGYPGYLPTAEMMAASAGANSPFMPSAGPNPGSSLPFFSMLPSIGSPQSAFQLPPHLLFPGYHPSAAAAAAAADAAYRSEMYRHRQSVDSAASTESQQRFSPNSRGPLSPEQRIPSATSLNGVMPSTQSPDSYPIQMNSSVSTTNNSAFYPHQLEEERRSVVSSHHSASPVSLTSSTQHQIHSPIAIRATPKTVSPTPTTVSVGSQSISLAQTPEPEPKPVIQNPNEVPENSSISFTAKMQSLSPVSVCSITAETTPSVVSATIDVEIAQDCPIDLSMKASRSSVHSFNTSAGESGVHSDASEEETMLSVVPRSRKYHELSSENDSDASSDDTDSAKRQKLKPETTPQNYNSFSHNAASLRGIFVCV